MALRPLWLQGTTLRRDIDHGRATAPRRRPPQQGCAANHATSSRCADTSRFRSTTSHNSSATRASGRHVADQTDRRAAVYHNRIVPAWVGASEIIRATPGLCPDYWPLPITPVPIPGHHDRTAADGTQPHCLRKKRNRSLRLFPPDPSVPARGRLPEVVAVRSPAATPNEQRGTARLQRPSFSGAAR
jgi:hypothetical protein